MICNICLSNDNEIVDVPEMMFGTKKLYAYNKCNLCGTLELIDHNVDLGSIYPSNYYSLKQNGKSFYQLLLTAHRKLLFFISFYFIRFFEFNIFNYNDYGIKYFAKIVKKQASILDIGCGRGDFLDILSFMGFKNLYGIDPYIKESKVSGKIKLFKSDIFNFKADSKFDIIYLNHSFEHMNSPFEIVNRINDLLKDDGYCFLRIPVADSEAFKIYKSNWFQIDAPRHIFLHTRKGLEKVLSANNLEIVSEIDDSTFMQFYASEQYSLGLSLFSENFKRDLILQKYFFFLSISKFVKRMNYYNYLKKVKCSSSGDQKTFVIKKKS